MMSQMLERQQIVEVRIKRSAALTPFILPCHPFLYWPALPRGFHILTALANSDLPSTESIL